MPIGLTQNDTKKHTFFSIVGKVLKKPLDLSKLIKIKINKKYLFSSSNSTIEHFNGIIFTIHHSQRLGLIYLV